MRRPQVLSLLPAGQPSEVIIAVHRSTTSGLPVQPDPTFTVTVDDPTAIGWLTDVLNRLTPRGFPPAPGLRLGVGAHDVLRFAYPSGEQRTVKVMRDGRHDVTAEGMPGVWSPVRPLHATIDSLLPEDLREDLGNPVSYPPSRNPHCIGEEDAIAIALGGACGPLPVDHPPVFARFMTRDETGELDPSLGANNFGPHPARKVWLVSVHGATQTRGDLVHPPTTVHGYSVVIDAETGMVTDMGWGTAPLGKQSCEQCRLDEPARD
jgi:hypothetical protein